MTTDPPLGPTVAVQRTGDRIDLVHRNADWALHNDHGPANVLVDSADTPFPPRKQSNWYSNGCRHRVDGPARVNFDADEWSTLDWFKNGRRHRLDGPSGAASDGWLAWHCLLPGGDKSNASTVYLGGLLP